MFSTASLLMLTTLTPADAARAQWEPSQRHVETYNLGVEALNSGDLEAAEKAFKKVLRREPDCGMAQLGMSQVLMRQARNTEASEVLVKASALFPEQTTLLVHRSELAFITQDFPLAMVLSRKALEQEPRSIEALLTSFNVLLRTGAYDEAADLVLWGRKQHPSPPMDCLDIQLRIERDPTGDIGDLWPSCQQASEVWLVQNARLARAWALGDEGEQAAAARDMGAAAVAPLSSVNRALQDGDDERTLAELDAALEVSPQRPDVRLLRARLRHRTGDREGALEDLEAVVGADPWIDISERGTLSGIIRKSNEQDLLAIHASAYALLARIAAEAGDLEAAADYLARGYTLDTPAWELAVAEAELSFSKGDHGEGWASLTEALHSWPDEPELLYVVGLKLNTVDGELPENLSAAILGASDWTLAFNLAVRHYNASEFTEALATLSGMTALDDSDAHAQVLHLSYITALELDDLATADELLSEGASPILRHVWLRQLVGQPAEALALLRAIGDPGEEQRQQATQLEVMLLCDLGQLDEALAIASGPHANAMTHLILGYALMDARRYDEARGLLQEACPALTGDEAAECRRVLEQL